MKTLPAYSRYTQRIWARPHLPRPLDIALVAEIQEAADGLQNVDDKHLAARTCELRQQLQTGASVLDCDLLRSCFALVTEAVRRVTECVFYDVQLLAGIALASGAIAEMKTGEGKTLVAALPVCLRALLGEGVHLATVNSYLAGRDFQHLQAVYELLGFSTGLLKDGDLPDAKRAAYRCDITYGTGYEFGFDYLRDQAAGRSANKPMLGETLRNQLRGIDQHIGGTMQRGHAFAVIDEVDSVLIDEANTPLVLSMGPGQESVVAEPYSRAAEIAGLLIENQHYVLDRRGRSIALTELGHAVIFESQQIVPVDGLRRPWQTYVEHALRAEIILQRDVDYVIHDNEVRIVDQYTGRIFSDRTWRDGLHQAVEVKERVPVTHEQSSVGRISRQRYFGFYKSLCGMTGTATGHEREFQEFYGLPVVVIPERLPNQRRGFPTCYFATRQAKWDAIADDIAARSASGQPILVGTRTIDESIELSKLLTAQTLRHHVLNGLQTEDEAAIVSRAGQLGAITIATNMAGRGTDIRVDPQVVALGGLHVIASERQESQRVDRQLIGRSARQGNPGSYQFFVSADDDLIQQFEPELGERLRSISSDLNQRQSELDAEMDGAQQKAEQLRFQQRSDLFRQDQWLNDVLTTVAEKDQPTPEFVSHLSP